jgi:hypothetical protein
MSAFVRAAIARERLQLGAKLPLKDKESLSGWLFGRIIAVIDNFEISYISLM